MNPVTKPLLIIVTAGSAANAVAQTAPNVAPLPEGLAPSNAAKLHGLHAMSTLGGPGVEDALDHLAETCGERLKIENEEQRYKGQRHIYRTSASLAVYEDVPTIETDEAACTARIGLRRTVKGGIGPWQRIRTDDWSESGPNCPHGVARECRASKVADVSAMCVTLGDPFQGSVSCVSSQRDLSYGLTLSYATYLDYDDGNRIDWQIGKVDVDALIDPVVFASFRN